MEKKGSSKTLACHEEVPLLLANDNDIGQTLDHKDGAVILADTEEDLNPEETLNIWNPGQFKTDSNSDKEAVLSLKDIEAVNQANNKETFNIADDRKVLNQVNDSVDLNQADHQAESKSNNEAVSSLEDKTALNQDKNRQIFNMADDRKVLNLEDNREVLNISNSIEVLNIADDREVLNQTGNTKVLNQARNMEILNLVDDTKVLNKADHREILNMADDTEVLNQVNNREVLNQEDNEAVSFPEDRKFINPTSFFNQQLSVLSLEGEAVLNDITNSNLVSENSDKVTLTVSDSTSWTKDDDEIVKVARMDWHMRGLIGTKISRPSVSNIYEKQGYNIQLLSSINDSNINEVFRSLVAGASTRATCHTEDFTACQLTSLRPHSCSAMLLLALLHDGAERHRVRADRLGRTALHLAVWAGNLAALVVLLQLPTEMEKVFDNRTLSPEEAIKKYSQTNLAMKEFVNMKCVPKNTVEDVPVEDRDGKNHRCHEFYVPHISPGWTALHAAASTARPACCRVLLAAGAEPYARDEAGRTPLQVAGSYYNQHKELSDEEARRLSNDDFTAVIEILLKVSSKDEIIKEYAELDYIDTPLHTAVLFKNIKAMELLLASGFSPRVRNQEGFTPFHLCAETNDYFTLITLTSSSYKYLNDITAPVEDISSEDGYTAFHYAVLNNSENGVEYFISHLQPNFVKPNKKGDTPLHTASALGYHGILGQLLYLSCFKTHIDAVNKNGETALFKAIMANQDLSVKILLQAGASVRITLPGQINVFHVAAKVGNVDILNQLIYRDDACTKEYINALTDKGYGPIHFAVENNHYECTKVLCANRAFIALKMGIRQLTVLHIAARSDNVDILKCIVKIMRETKSEMLSIDTVDSNGWTPLHTACFFANRDIIEYFIGEGADLSASTKGPDLYIKTAVEIMMDNLTKPTEFLERIFDNYIKKEKKVDVASDYENPSPDLQVTVDYSILIPNIDHDNQVLKSYVIDAILKSGNGYGQRRLMLHPLVESFLCLKWRTFLPFFCVMLLIYGLFVITCTAFVMTNLDEMKKRNGSNESIGMGKEIKTDLANIGSGAVAALFISIVLVLIQELILMAAGLKHYIKQKESWIKLLTVTLAGSLPSSINKEYSESPRHIATVVVLLSWLYMTYLLCRFPRWGYYVSMFKQVTQHVLKILTTFAFFMIGFSLSFMIQFQRESPFDGFWSSLVKTMVMMTEFDYNSLNGNDTANSFFLFRVVFVLFMILGAISLMNMMISVAVQDMTELAVQGRIMRLEQQAEYLSSLQASVFKKIYLTLLPTKLKSSMEVTELILTSNKKTNWWNSNHLPKSVRNAIFDKALANNNDTTPTPLDLKMGDLDTKMDMLNAKLELICNKIEKL